MVTKKTAVVEADETQTASVAVETPSPCSDIDTYAQAMILSQREQAARIKAVSDALGKEFPQAAIQQRVGAGGKKLNYLMGQTVIRRTNESTNNSYSMDYVDHFFQDGKFFLMLTVEIEGMGKRLGLGVANMSGGEDVLKGAITDAFKNAMKYFGVGLELYGEDFEAEAKPIHTPPKVRLSQLLGANGIKTKAAANKAAQDKFGKDLENLDATEIASWIAALEPTEPVPF